MQNELKTSILQISLVSCIHLFTKKHFGAFSFPWFFDRKQIHKIAPVLKGDKQYNAPQIKRRAQKKTTRRNIGFKHNAQPTNFQFHGFSPQLYVLLFYLTRSKNLAFGRHRPTHRVTGFFFSFSFSSKYFRCKVHFAPRFRRG